MNESHCGRQHRPLNAFLTAAFDERFQVSEITELQLYTADLAPEYGQRLSNLRNRRADWPAGTCTGCFVTANIRPNLKRSPGISNSA